MKCPVFTVLLVATVIGLAYSSYPPKYPTNGRSAVAPWNPRSSYFMHRLGRVGPLDEEEQWDSVEALGRKYKIADKKSKKKAKQPVVEDEPEDDEPEDDEPEDDEPEDDEDDVNDELNSQEEEDALLDLPPWQRLFPNKENLPKKPDGPPPEDGPGGYGGEDEIYRRVPVQGPPQGPSQGPPQGPPPPNVPRQRRFRSELPWEGETDYSAESYEQPIRPRRYPVSRPILATHLDRRTGKQVRIITGWSDTVLQDNFNPEYIVNPTLMRLRRKRRYHPSQQIPLQKISLRGQWGNPRDAYNYVSPGGQHWTTGPFQPYVYSHK